MGYLGRFSLKGQICVVERLFLDLKEQSDLVELHRGIMLALLLACVNSAPVEQ